jgi:regulator of sigma E protease
MSLTSGLSALPLATFGSSLMAIVHFIPVILGVLVIFNLIIVVHELGHFLAARWRGWVIEEFGVWFGKPLWRKKFNGVWYSLGSIPAGGFVKLPQLGMKSIEGEAETPEEELPPVKPLDRIIVAFAGPLFSFLLALALATVIWKVGKPYHQEDNTTIIGAIAPEGPAAKAGLKTGDKILAIDGKPVNKFIGPVDSVIWAIVSSEGPTIHFDVERNGQKMAFDSGWTKEQTPGWNRKPLRKVQIGPLVIPEVGRVEPKGPAEAAGIQKGDLVTAVNGTPIIGLADLVAIVEKNPTAPLKLTLKRHGEPNQQAQIIETTLTPTPPKKGEEEEGPEFGLAWGSIRLDYPTPWQQVADSVRAIGNMLESAVSPKSDVKVQHFSGPVGIMNLYRRILQSEEPLRYAIAFSVFFNVNLALINLVPLPVLDGGHIMIGFLELIRRRPIRNIRIMEIAETACTLLILGFILYVTFFDVGDLFHKPGAAPAPAPTPAVQATPAPAK